MLDIDAVVVESSGVPERGVTALDLVGAVLEAPFVGVWTPWLRETNWVAAAATSLGLKLWTVSSGLHDTDTVGPPNERTETNIWLRLNT